MSLSLSHWYPGSGVVLDCIDSLSLHPYLLSYCCCSISKQVASSTLPVEATDSFFLNVANKKSFPSKFIRICHRNGYLSSKQSVVWCDERSTAFLRSVRNLLESLNMFDAITDVDSLTFDSHERFLTYPSIISLCIQMRYKTCLGANCMSACSCSILMN